MLNLNSKKLVMVLLMAAMVTMIVGVMGGANPVIPNPPSNDLDKDGVPNYVDQCPNQPGPWSNHGCPVQKPDKPSPYPDGGGSFCITTPFGQICNGASKFNQLKARSQVIKPGHRRYNQLLRKFNARRQMVSFPNRQNLQNFNGYSMRRGLNQYQIRNELNSSGLSYLGRTRGKNLYVMPGSRYVMPGSTILVIMYPWGPYFIILPYFPPLPWFFSLLMIIF